MFINLLKSAAWGFLYIVATFVAIFISVLGYAIIILVLQDDMGLDCLMQNPELIMQTLEIPIYIIMSLICIVVFLFYKIIRKKAFDIKRVEVKKAVFASSLAVFLNVVISVSTDFALIFFPQDIVDAITTPSFEGPILLLLLCVGILVPFAEEIIFRHGIHSIIARSNLTAAYIISSLVFGFAHGNLIQFLYTALLGFAMALLFTNTDNIWYPFIMHISFNSLTVLSDWIIPKPIYYAIAGIASIVCIIVMLIKYDDIRHLFNFDKNPFYVPKQRPVPQTTQYGYPVYVQQNAYMQPQYSQLYPTQQFYHLQTAPHYPMQNQVQNSNWPSTYPPQQFQTPQHSTHTNNGAPIPNLNQAQQGFIQQSPPVLNQYSETIR